MASDPSSSSPRRPRFHGRVEGARQACAVEGCEETGEFRAPLEAGGVRGDRPGNWRWLCLEHVRAFNQGYNYFSGMSPDEIEAAQRPYAGWERETRAFSSNAFNRPPKWEDFSDPLDAINTAFRARREEAKARYDGKPLSGDDRAALRVLDLGTDADRKALRARYTELVRRYHPDHNGGDRSLEKKLQAVIEAYQHLRKAPAFA